jgi:hypothetical protein
MRRAGCHAAPALNAGQIRAVTEKLKIAVVQSESLVCALGFFPRRFVAAWYAFIRRRHQNSRKPGNVSECNCTAFY